MSVSLFRIFDHILLWKVDASSLSVYHVCIHARAKFLQPFDHSFTYSFFISTYRQSVQGQKKCAREKLISVNASITEVHKKLKDSNDRLSTAKNDLARQRQEFVKNVDLLKYVNWCFDVVILLWIL